MCHKFSHQLEKNSFTIEVWLSETVYPEFCMALIVFQIAAANVALATFAFKELHKHSVSDVLILSLCSSVVLNIVFSVFSLV